MTTLTTTPGEAGDAAFEARSFLIVDDFQGIRTMLRDSLRVCGASTKNIATASNGNEALHLLSARRYDVVICDYNLGHGKKNGQQLFEEAKAKKLVGPACCWVVISADKSTETVMGSAETEPDAYLIKPFNLVALRNRLARAWRKKAAFTEIDEALANHNTLHAIALCDERLRTDVEHEIDLLRMKAKLLLAIGDTDAARNLFNEALVRRDMPWAQLGLAKAHFLADDHQLALELLEHLVDNNRSYLDAYDWLAKTLSVLGDDDRARQVLERATALSPNALHRQKALGEAALKSQHLEQAEKAFRRCISLGENTSLTPLEAYLGLARTCVANGKADEALKLIEQARAGFPGEEATVRTTATEVRVYHATGSTDLAVKTGQKLGHQLVTSAVFINSDTSMDIAELLLSLGLKEESIAVLEFQVKNNPQDKKLLEQAHRLLALSDAEGNGKARIEALVNDSLELMNRGVLLARDGKLDEAVASMRHAKSRLPSNIRVMFNLVQGLIMHIQKNGPNPTLLREAKKTLQDAQVIAPQEKRGAELARMIESLAPSSGVLA